MKQKQTLLIAEDNEVNRKLLSNMLKEEYNIIEAVDGVETIEILADRLDEVSALLLDIIMPNKNGYDVLNYMRENDISHLPIIVMTGASDEESEEKVLDMGAWDYITKPYKPKVLKTRLKNAIARSQIDYLAQVKHLAEHDQLTDLYNRRHFFEVTEELIQEHAAEKIAFIRMDINQFRLVNSFLGEAGGDALLRFCAECIKKLVEGYKYGTFGHVESDIFAFCMPYEREDCEKQLQQLTKEISKYDKGYLIESTFGIYLVEDARTPAEEMYICATVAAKKCKNKMLTYFMYFNQEMGKDLQLEQEITYEMQQALDTEQFQVYFQPKYNAQTQTPYGAEALVRWKHPEKGMISPGVFIPVFEKNGFIGKLDFYIWSKVCEYIKKWISEGLSPAPVSVNMSRAELSNPNLIQMLVQLVKMYEIPANLLHLELTESAYMDNPDIINEVIRKLHEAGFTVLMDDFGSGYSSLNTLKDIEVDILKIDMKFLSLDENNTKSKKILTTVISMAQWLGIPVITEGVETAEQFAFLQSIGCEYNQGYYFAKPMPLKEYETLIHDNKPIEAKYNSCMDADYMIPKQLKDKIYKDELTGAYNRRYLNEWLFLDIDDTNKENYPLAVVLLDLKSFKIINDTEGHLMGDALLKKVSETLLSHIRSNDAVIRYGGDEFIIIFTKCSESVVVRKIRELKEAIPQIQLPKDEYFSGADFGYSYTDHFEKNKDVLNAMIHKADLKMYSEKRK